MATNARGRATSDRLLDAAEEAMARHGLSVTMDDVADAAGVTRSTVYRHLGDRDAVITAVVLRSTARVGEQVNGILGRPEPFARRLADALVLIIGQVRDTPHLRALATAGDTGRLWPDIDRANRFPDTVVAFFRPWFVAAVAEEGVRLRAEVDDVLDWLPRQALLPLLIVGRRGIGDAAIRHDVERFVLPAVIVDAGTA